MRTFTLINKDGAKYDVTTKNSIFFHSITGLGFEKESEFQRIDERFKLLKSQYAQQKIEGIVRFWQPNAEQAYFDFAQFCQNEPIRMAYNPKSGNVSSSGYENAYVDGTGLFLPSKYLSYENYYRDGYITKIERSDGVDESLTIKIQFTARTPWFKTINEYNYGGTVSARKKYDYTYPYNYNGGAQNTVVIDSDSWMQSPVRLIIMGGAENPRWNHYLNGELQTTGKIIGTILPGNKLVIDTTTIPYTIKEYDANGNEVLDMYQLSDFSTERFVRLGHGRNMITVGADDVSELGVGVEAQIEYATV